MLASDVGVRRRRGDPRPPARVAREERALRRRRRVGGAPRRGDARSSRDRRRGAIRSSAKPTVVLMVGVNGVGKTTTIGKLATRYSDGRQEGRPRRRATRSARRPCSSSRSGASASAEVVKGKEGADPGAVAFDATTRPKKPAPISSRRHGRPPSHEGAAHGRNQEGAQDDRKALDGAPHETLLVLDATTGQNALAQASAVQGGARSHRHRADEARRHGEGRHRPRHLRRARRSRSVTSASASAQKTCASSTPRTSSRRSSVARKKQSPRSERKNDVCRLHLQ